MKHYVGGQITEGLLHIKTDDESFNWWDTPNPCLVTYVSSLIYTVISVICISDWLCFTGIKIFINMGYWNTRIGKMLYWCNSNYNPVLNSITKFH